MQPKTTQSTCAPDVVPANAKLRARYQRREPEKTVLWQVVHGWLETFLEQAAQTYHGGLPYYVQNELRRYLECGILACGFARAFCSECGASMLVAFSCKTRGVCCSCGARRSAQTAANLVDRVLPDVPLRQWVLSAPFDSRIPMARDAALLTAVTRIFCSEIDRLLQRLGEERGVRRGASGQVASIQLFGGAINPNPHQHVLALDGVYSTSADGRVVFTATRAPAQSELLDVTQRVHTRVLRWLERHGAGDDEDNAGNDEPSPAASCAQLSLRLGKLGYVDSDGVAHEPDADHARFGMRKNTPWSAEYEGWSLHAGVTIAAGDDEGRERLCRYVVRHALSMERMSWTKDGRIAYAVKYARSPTRTHLLLDPVQFLARLAALIPAPRHPLVRYVGVLSSASKWRRHVVPGLQRDGSCPHANAASQPASPPTGSARTARSTDACRTAMAAPRPADAQQPDGNLARGCVQAATNYIDWHTLLARVYDMDSFKCPRCGGQLRMIAVLTEPEPIRAILESMGLPSTPPVPARARYPSLFDESQLAGCDVA